MAVGIGNSVMASEVVIRPILLPPISVNQSAPSGPAVMPPGLPLVGNSLTIPPGAIRPILFPLTSVNQMPPSGPDAMLSGPLFAVGIENSIIMDL